MVSHAKNLHFFYVTGVGDSIIIIIIIIIIIVECA